jgi:hypothetical protein
MLLFCQVSFRCRFVKNGRTYRAGLPADSRDSARLIDYTPKNEHRRANGKAGSGALPPTSSGHPDPGSVGSLIGSSTMLG